MCFLGAIATDQKDVWRDDIEMNGELINFKLDTGAAVTIPDSMFCKARDGDLVFHDQSCNSVKTKQT